jgi:hypothetical protein
MATFRGTHGDDNLTGTSGDDNFILVQGGNDTVDAGDGNDIFRMGGALNAGDKLDGGAGKDFIVLNGDYSAGVVFNDDTITNIEVIGLDPGHSYNLTLADGNVATGQRFLVKAGTLGAGDTLTFDGSAETDGKYTIIAGAGDDTLTGGAKADVFDLSHGGIDTVHGGAGTDTFLMGGALTAADQIDGGTGNDTVVLDGDYGGILHPLAPTTLTNVETVRLVGGHNYEFSSPVADGTTMTIDASGLSVLDLVDWFNSGSATGAFHFIAGPCQNGFIGGAGNDIFDLMQGSSVGIIAGHGGNDTFNLGGNYRAGGAQGLDGGTGNDTVNFDGPYAGTLALMPGGLGLQGMDTVQFGAGHDYAVLVAGQIADTALTIDASALNALNNFSVDLGAATSTAYTFTGGAGDDTVTFGANFGVVDAINGGSGGNDTLVLNGDYTAGLTFGPTTIANIDTLQFRGGFGYTVVTDDGNVAAGATLTLDATALSASDPFSFNGSAETDGNFVFAFAGGFTSTDSVHGGAGNDTLVLDGDTYNGFTFGANTMTGIETLRLIGAHNYFLTPDDANVAAGQTLTVDASTVTGDLSFGGAVETDGNFHFIVGAVSYMTLNAGAGNDVFDLTGAGSAHDNALAGNGGDDLFLVGADFNTLPLDNPIAGDAGNDTLELNGNYSSLLINGSKIAGIDTIRFDGGHTYGNVTVDEGGAFTVTIDASQVTTLFELDFGLNPVTVEVGSGGMDAHVLSVTAYDDTFIVTSEAALAASTLNPLNGTDTLELNGNFSTALTLGTSTMLNFEILKLDAGHGYNLIFNDSNVAAGQTLTADFSALTSGTVILNGGAETDGSFDFVAGAASAITLTGGANGDVFDLTGAGSDTIHALAGNAGNDTYLFGGDFSNLNILAAMDGGAGIDTAEFNGDYATLFLNFQKFANVETFKFDAGHSYGNVTIDESTVSGGVTVDASAVTTLFHLTYTTNAFTVDVGSGGMIATTTATHNDTFIVTSESGLAASALDAGTGLDTLELNGDFSTLFTFGASTITNIEVLVVDGGHDYNLKTVDATVASGKTLVVSAAPLAANTLTFDGSAETDGSFSITGGNLGDTLTGGANGDSFTGALGADTLTGGGGADTFNYAAGNNSNTSALDTITDFTAGTDKFHTNFTTTFQGEFTSAAATGTLDGDIAAAFAANGGGAHSGFVFDFNGADFNGHSYLVVDSNGNAAYDAGTDLVVEITGHTGTVTSGDFI